MFLVLSCYIADLVFGDPEWFPHPVRVIGRLITFLDNNFGIKQGKFKDRIKGTVAAVSVVLVSAFLAYFILEASYKISPFLGVVVWVYLGYTTLSIKDLFVKSKEVLKEINTGSLTQARQRLSRIVGRDTHDLSEERIIKATVESIAESTNDGVVAPLFYLIIGGPVLAVTYKAINTLDSMIGYKDEKYNHFGWFSARLDDVANYIPARITGLLIAVSSFILGKSFRGSFKVMLRDGRKHPSPNSGISEAAMAGALGIRLGGPSTYQGRLSVKSYLGEDKKETRPSLIKEALKLSFIASVLMVAGGVIVKWLV